MTQAHSIEQSVASAPSIRRSASEASTKAPGFGLVMVMPVTLAALVLAAAYLSMISR